MIKRNLVTQEELDTLAQIDRDCIRMHVCPPPKTFVSFEAQDAEGNVLDSFVMKSNSWVRNMYAVIATQCLGVPGITDLFVNDFGGGALVTGATWNITSPDDVRGTAGSTAKGMVVGTDTTAESFLSFKLGALIAPGNSSGTLAYQAQSAAVKSYNSETKKHTAVHSRIFNNNSGAGIVVSEVGIHWNYRLLCRDVLSSPVPVPNGGQLTVTYTIEMTFPG